MSRRLLPSIAIAIISLSYAAPRLFAQATGTSRQWTNAAGKSIDAVLLNADETTATLKLATGKNAEVPIASLSEADQKLIAELREQRAVLPQMPQSAPISPTGSHFEVAGQGKLEDELLAKFEAIFAVADVLPFGLDPKPGPNQDRFQVMLADSAGYRSLLSNMQMDPNAQPNAAYIPDEVALYVNYTNIRADKLTSEKQAEIEHEAGNLALLRWRYVLPPWLVDGVSGCLASVPIRSGAADLAGRELGLKQFLAARFTEGRSKPISATGAEKLIRKTSMKWTPTSADRAGAIILAYYFLFVDDSAGSPGVGFSKALASVDTMRKDTSELLMTSEGAEDDFERKRLAFNKKIEEYNVAVAAHRTAVMAYNARITKFNEQMKAGIPEGERVDVGQAPVVPVAPKKDDALMEKPNLDPNADPAGTDDFEKAMELVLPQLLQGRTATEIQTEVEEAFKKMGVPLKFE